MTREEREEAIKVIQNFPIESTEERKAVLTAIKALEQMPVTTTTEEGGVIYYPQVEGVTPTVIDAGKQEPVFFPPCQDCNTKMNEIRRSYDKLQEPCGNTIDRAEAMTEIMMFAGNVKSDEEDIYIKVSDAVQLLRDLPPVNPTKTGYWIHTDECDEEWQYRCSICNMPSRSNSHRYCSNCGSYMYGVETQERSDKE